jgi:hypothetical protein
MGILDASRPRRVSVDYLPFERVFFVPKVIPVAERGEETDTTTVIGQRGRRIDGINK